MEICDTCIFIFDNVKMQFIFSLVPNARNHIATDMWVRSAVIVIQFGLAVSLTGDHICFDPIFG